MDTSENLLNPVQLKSLEEKSSEGVKILGMGFVISEDLAKTWIEINPNQKEILKKFMNGDDLVNDPLQLPSRLVIDFWDRTEDECIKMYSESYNYIHDTVKPIRMKDNRESYRKYWWQFAEKRKSFRSKILNSKYLLATNNNSRHYSISIINKDFICSHSLTLFSI